MSPEVSSGTAPGFRHEALVYSNRQEFLDGTLPFIREGIEAGDLILAVLPADKIAILRSQLDGDADRVRFADAGELGNNPARLIPAWREFVDASAASGRRIRGIGEPIHSGRTPAELAECHRHELLLNLAFADASDLWLLCPYDAGALDPAVIEEAERTHPVIAKSGDRRPSERFVGVEGAAAPFAEPLPEPPSRPHQLIFDPDSLGAVRTFVAISALDAGLDGDRTDDLILAVNELAANSIVHAGGKGELLIWQDGDSLLCEVRDPGFIDAPLAGREVPDPGSTGGCGLWMANQLCDLVQIRTFAHGSAVRLHMRGLTRS
jgi:anti-sigma regulatory factor (Ser/Thr protein kinase)